MNPFTAVAIFFPLAFAAIIISGNLNDAEKSSEQQKETIVINIDFNSLDEEKQNTLINHLNYKSCVQGVVDTPYNDDILSTCGTPTGHNSTIIDNNL